MTLPPDVKCRPNQPGLIGPLGGASLIQVPPDYGIGRYPLEKALEPYLSGTWYDWAAKHNISFSADAYAAGENNEFVIAVARDIPTQNSQHGMPKLFASFLDSFTPEPLGKPPAVRVCELQTYGIAVIDCGTGVLDLLVGKDGDKLIVPTGSCYAFYGLGEPLITVEVGWRLVGDKSRRWSDWLHRFGAPLLAYYTDQEIVFELNDLHVNSENHNMGVRLPGRTLDPDGRRIHLPRVTRASLPPFLYAELTTNMVLAGQFRELGIQIRKASPEAILPPDLDRDVEFGTPVYFSGPLSRESASIYPKSRLRSYLGVGGESALGSREFKDPGGRDLLKGMMARMEEMKKYVDLSRPETRRLQIVVVGTGAWTLERYRPDCSLLP